MLNGVSASLGIAVVHHRTPDVALACLARLAVAAPTAQVVVVDTAPEPEFQRLLAQRHPGVRFLPAPNHSYARSVNLGVAALDSTYVALMNADVLVRPSTLSELLAVVQSSGDRAVVAPVAHTADGRLQQMGLPYWVNYRRLGATHQPGDLRAADQQAHDARANDQQADDPQADDQHTHGAPADDARTNTAPPASIPVAWLGAYLQVMHNSVWRQLGGYDEAFRFFNEDLDFCLRLREHGYGSRLVNSPVVHLGGTSTPSDPAFHVEGRRGGMLVTLRHHGVLYGLAHRAYLWGEALVGSVAGGSHERRSAHLAMLRLLRTGRWHDSPFGATLDERRTDSVGRS